jgi:hypothetical protein
MIAWFVAGEILHVLFCVDSAFLKVIGVSTQGGNHTKDS